MLELVAAAAAGSFEIYYKGPLAIRSQNGLFR